MILKQVFKTLDGALKRCRFENAHSPANVVFTIVWCRNGVPYKRNEWSRENHGEFTWQLEKERV
jgi:hypothetical protein